MLRDLRASIALCALFRYAFPIVEDTAPSQWELVAMTYPRPIVRRISGRGSFVLGRSSQANIRIPDASVSRLHARLSFGAAAVEIEDLESANGTRLVVIEKLSTATNLHEHRLKPGEPMNVPENATVYVGDVAVLVRAARRHTEAPIDIVAISEAMRETLGVVQQLAHSALHVVLVGEPGVGRDTLARGLHRASARAHAPFVHLHAKTWVDTLMEQELFGYERGAFRGATETKIGLLERAEGGTVMIDGIDLLSNNLQSQLLRALANRQIQRMGERRPRPLDVRLVAGVTEETPLMGTLHKLGAATLRVPPLRERRDDIEPLARALARRAAAERAAPELSQAALEALQRYDYPENVRELAEIVTRAVPLAGRGVILPEHLLLRDENGVRELADETESTQIRQVPKLPS